MRSIKSQFLFDWFFSLKFYWLVANWPDRKHWPTSCFSSPSSSSSRFSEEIKGNLLRNQLGRKEEKEKFLKRNEINKVSYIILTITVGRSCPPTIYSRSVKFLATFWASSLRGKENISWLSRVEERNPVRREWWVINIDNMASETRLNDLLLISSRSLSLSLVFYLWAAATPNCCCSFNLSDKTERQGLLSCSE